ncbi:MAG: hypothetical protein ACYTHJ_05620 [Planctomycetota bacterium]
MRSEPIANQESLSSHAAVSLQRRNDVDWLRTMAMGLLIAYFLLPGELPAYLKLALLLASTFGVSLDPL